jgi:hypothetical protein
VKDSVPGGRPRCELVNHAGMGGLVVAIVDVGAGAQVALGEILGKHVNAEASSRHPVGPSREDAEEVLQRRKGNDGQTEGSCPNGLGGLD